MSVACWSAKGGVGTTVVAVSLAVVLARSSPHGALLVDLAGDAPAVLGVPEPEGPGVAEWLAMGERVPPDAWARLETDAGSGLRLVARGWGPLPGNERATVLLGLLAAEHRPVVVDAGVLHVLARPRDAARPDASGGAAVSCEEGAGAPGGLAHLAAATATASLLVTRSCYLALRRAVAVPLHPSGVVLVEECGRALDARDVADVVGAPVVARVPWEPAVARAVDAGLLAGRLPRSLERALRSAA